MNVRALYEYINKKIPLSLSAGWDNDGLMVCPDSDREVRRVLIALDVTAEVVDEAITGGFDAIISHHPLIFTPLRSLTHDNSTAAKVINLTRAGVSVMSFHTRLDALRGGVNDILADMLGIVAAVPLEGEMFGRIGNLVSPMSLEQFSRRVKSVLRAPALLVSGCGRDVSTVAVVGGAGSDAIEYARAAGADTFLSGSIGYHEMMIAGEIGMNMIEAGHFHTEDPVCSRLAKLVAEASDNIETVYMRSYRFRFV